MATTTTRHPRSEAERVGALRADPLAEVARRLEAIYVSVDEATDDDTEIRRWTAQKLTELINDVHAAKKSPA